MATITEKELIQACLRNDRNAQRQFYQQFSSKMMGVSMRYASSIEEAEDWLQDGFITAFNKLDTYKFKGSLEGWLRMIIKNTALQNIRKAKKGAYLVSVDEYPVEEETVEEEINNLAPFKAVQLIQQLPDGCRAIFNLYSIEGYKHKEIAEILQINIGTSKSQLNRARKLLKEMLHNKGLYISKK